MTRFAKILSSGSPAEVTSITASDLPDATGEDKEFVVLSGADGRFFTSSRLYFTGSSGGQFTAEDTNLSVFTITASGLPDTLTDRTSVVFINDDGGLETTGSLRYLSNGNALVFDGVYSGSFTGDGSGLTGVIGNVANPLVNGPGIASSSDGGAFEWNGSEPVTLQVLVGQKGGLELSGSSPGQSGLKLTASLPGDGLKWKNTDNYSVMQVALSGSSNGTSGLKLDSNGLALSDNIAGNGIARGSNNIFVDLANNSGLNFASGQLRLNPALAGTGLSWANQYTELEIDTSVVVDNTRTITMKTGSSNLTLTATSDATPTQVAGGFRAKLIDNPVFTYDINSDLTGSFTHAGPSFTIDGNLDITGNSVVIGKLTIEDSFPLISSGNDVDAGLQINTSDITAAYIYYETTSERWGISNGTISQGITDHDITDEGNAAINSVTITLAAESTIVNSALNPIFGNNATNRVGQVMVKTNQDASESPIFIYA